MLNMSKRLRTGKIFPQGCWSKTATEDNDERRQSERTWKKSPNASARRKLLKKGPHPSPFAITYLAVLRSQTDEWWEMSQRLKETAVPKRRSGSDLPISQNGDSKLPLLSVLRNTLSKL